MRSRIIKIFLVFLLSSSTMACSNNESDLNPNITNGKSNISSDLNYKNNIQIRPSSDGKTENMKTQMASKNRGNMVTTEKLLDILSTKNKEVFDTLGILESDKITKYLDNKIFTEPVFQCKKFGILIGFGGVNIFKIDTVKNYDATPEFIIPINGTKISFDNNLSFRVGDDFREIRNKLGEGILGDLFKATGTNQNPKSSTLTYDIKGLTIRFTSLEGEDFEKYNVLITRFNTMSVVNTKMNYTNSDKDKKLAIEGYNGVLRNKSNFIQAHNEKSVNLETYLKGINKNIAYQVTNFTVIDLDEDKIPEIYLGITKDGRDYIELYLILWYTNGSVHSYEHGNKGFNGLKEDGTFHHSSGISFDGYARRCFDNGIADTSVFGYRESSQYDDEFSNSYFINNKRVTEESYEVFSKQQDEKKDAVWHEFSKVHIDAELENQ